MSSGKHSRRSALKYLARVGVGTTLWGAGGYGAGRVFDYTVKPVVDSVLQTSERVNEVSEGLSNLNPFKEKSVVRLPLSRRGFFHTLAKKFYDNPISSGTVAGVIYGGSKSAIGGIPKYLTQRQLGVLRDENADYRERLEVLEDYKRRLEMGVSERDARVGRLESELGRVNALIGETKRDSGTSGRTLVIIGAFGLISSIVLSSTALTGNVIGSFGDQSHFLASAMFIVSLTLILKGVSGKKGIWIK